MPDDSFSRNSTCEIYQPLHEYGEMSNIFIRALLYLAEAVHTIMLLRKIEL